LFRRFCTTADTTATIRGGVIEIEKGQPTYFPLRTRRPSLPIVSRLAAPSARWLFSSTHACQIVRQSSYWLPPGIIGVTALMLARFYSVTSVPHPTCKRLGRKHTFLLPEMILRLRVARCQSQSAETRSTNNTAVAARSGLSLRLSARVSYQKIHSSNWRSLKL